ncbi:MAG TPA: histidinol-phosphate transaminase [Candidatus Syntrophoarchaeum butanivorans]|uniref:Histidinol-phosphate aminotransferase n=1 Tax=Candidatus Syntropharchaeum butanivorans TaxID=1839936 RepID=A0A7C1B5A2_9EURY|nr:histidinol-phosphate transaminase [Candidatus Syntrophoarchaeum butanivorans]
MVKVKTSIEEIEQYRPGETVEETAHRVELDVSEIIKLASNENVLGPSPAAVQAIISGVDRVNTYPTVDAIHLRSEILSHLGEGFLIENIVCGNGSDGVIEALVHLFIEDGDEAIIPIPTFSFYELVVRMHGGRPVFLTRDSEFGFSSDEIISKVTDRTKLIFIASPNNPTGNSIDEQILRDLLESLDAMIILDEAYIEFSSKPSLNRLVLEYDNLAVIHTFSKAYGLAGMRVGYGVIPGWLFPYYTRATPPFAVNTLAEAAAIAALRDEKHLERTRKMVEDGKKLLTAEIPFKVYPGDANFVLVDTSPLTSREVSEALKSMGIIVRDCAGFRGMGDSFIRITIGRREDNRRVVEALRKIKNRVI